jgi:hypothetical protein
VKWWEGGQFFKIFTDPSYLTRDIKSLSQLLSLAISAIFSSVSVPAIFLLT